MATTLAIDFTQGLNDAWSKIATFVPKLIGFLVVLVIGWFIAKMITKVLDRVLRKVGCERLSERAGTSRMLENSTYDLTGIISKIVYFALMLIVIQMALGVFGANPVSTMINNIVSWLPRGIVAVVLVVVAMAIANMVRSIVQGALSSASYGNTVATGVWGAIVALGVIAALGQAGIAENVVQSLLVAALATVAGILIVGVGGGMVMPMRQRMERMLSAAEEETSRRKGSMSAYQAGREDARRQTAGERTATGTEAGRRGATEMGRETDRPSDM
ncbi:hypothetical protein ABZ354_22865 [Streptomyces sp. NPDC005925]|uniref:mechanosensitive ion channel family protein n=1 Tax=Streptomyces sp. NPDC005925 TaxID=3157172 RepID=UPI0033C5BBBD